MRGLIVLAAAGAVVISGCNGSDAVRTAEPHSKSSPPRVKSSPPRVAAPTPSRGSVRIITDPDKKLTPGAVFAGVTSTEVCVAGWARKHRHVSTSLRKQVFAEYQVPWSQHTKYEADHLIPLELAGNNSIKNLWPEYQNTTGKAGYQTKDKLENHLHELVCSGQVRLSTAQHAMIDWRANYKRYMAIKVIHPHPVARSVQPQPSSTSRCSNRPSSQTGIRQCRDQSEVRRQTKRYIQRHPHCVPVGVTGAVVCSGQGSDL